MRGKRQIPNNSSMPLSRVEGRGLPASNRRSPENPGRIDCQSWDGRPASGIETLEVSDCRTCSRFGAQEPEPFVGPETVAKFLDIDPETVVRYARLGYLPAHPLHVIGKRMTWRFLLSEVREAMLSRTNTYSPLQQGQRA